MKKGIYIFRTNYKEESDLEASGVYKKIQDQCKVLREFFQVDLEIINGYGATAKSSFIDAFYKRLPFTPILEKWKYSDKYSEVDFLYMRRVIHDRSLLKFLREIKKNNEKTKIIYELPTYPYDRELKGFKNVPYILKDKINRSRLHKYVDRIVTFSNDTVIFNVPTIRITNGIDFVSTKKRKLRTVNHDINVIAVAVFSFWHGYDRFLRGMGQYYAAGGKRNILLHMVGDGVSMNEYKEIVEKYEIEDKVIFYGQKSGKELDKIYNISNIALECLGSHRKGISISSSLKSREYGAKGLPIITSNKIDYIPDDYKYQLRVPDDESTINMEQVIYFFDRIYQTEGDFEEVNKKIREFAEKNCDISITMRPVVEYILGED